MLRDALLVAGKDLRVEARSRVALNQVAPFAVLVLVLFAFALDPDRGVLDAGGGRPVLGGRAASPPCSPSSARRASRRPTGNRDALRLSGLDPAGIFLGKAGAVAVQLLAPRGRCSAPASSCSTTSTPPGWPRSP